MRCPLESNNHPVTEYIRYAVTTDDVITVSTTALAADGTVLTNNEYRWLNGKGASFAIRQ
ncbi:hypothetical protein BCF44_13114 [Kutzneria buriramensis]|uniref:Uncharacterized protein n=1 Tax=Kutzneria buriramensis TaxID=1045776 RepID=A0A3E0GV34_9PSEU|nr:hypothetical protein BCF44_13114 [Kutzneria buriramensis]